MDDDLMSDAEIACFIEGCIYADPHSPDPAARRAASRGVPPSRCARCGQVNRAMRSHLGWKTRKERVDSSDDATPPVIVCPDCGAELDDDLHRCRPEPVPADEPAADPAELYRELGEAGA